MTLTKKMALGVLGLLLFVFIGTYLITVNNARNYFNVQLQSNAQDTATSLGLSLSQALAKNDKASMLAMIQAVFDRGYFSSIQVKDLGGTVLVSREAKPNGTQAPRWFIDLLEEPNQEQSALVMRGWNQVGEVYVLANPDYAQTMLWITAKDLMKTYVFFALICLLSVYFFIRWLLQPLQRLKAQALAISASEFPIETRLPEATELREVTLAMNSMVLRVKSLFEAQIKQIENLYLEAYQDSLTRVANRQFFLQQVAVLLQQEENFVPGYFLIVSIDGLYELSKNNLHLKAKDLVIDVSKICVDFWSAPVFRISGNNFVIIIPYSNPETYQKSCSEFLHKLQEVEQHCQGVNIVIGSIVYQLHQSPYSTLKLLDEALNEARKEKGNIVYRGKQVDVEKLVSDVLNLEPTLIAKWLLLYSQQVIGNKGIFHEEILVRLRTPQGEELRPGYFLPYAEKLHMAHHIDLSVLAKAEKMLFASASSSNGPPFPLAFNIASDTLVDPQNRQAYLQKLAAFPLKIRKCIHVELNESLVLSNYSEVQSFFKELKKLLIKAGVDQFGLHFSSLHYLNELPISYVKLHGSLIQNITDSEPNIFSPQYFYGITKSLGIEVIATQVEKKEQWEALEAMSIRWGQGLFLAPIVPKS